MRYAPYLFVLVLLAVLLTGAATAQVLPSSFTPLGNNCTILDTVSPLPAGTTLFVPVRGICGIPEEANAVTLNVVTFNSPESGVLRVFDSGIPANTTFGVLDYRMGQTSRESVTVRLCHPFLECSGVDIGVQLVGGATRVTLVAQGHYQPNQPSQ